MSGRGAGGGAEGGGIVPADPAAGGGAATPSFTLPDGASNGLPAAPGPLDIGGARFEWGRRTYVMGIVNVTPDSFSGDGLLRTGADAVETAVRLAVRMADEGADLVDVGGESSRPGHAAVDKAEELRRVVPTVAAIRAALPAMPISVDTIKPAVASAAIEAGADLVNDVWSVGADDALLRVAAGREVPVVLMHNRSEARYRNLMAEIVADLERAIERALAAGVAWERILVDPGFGFGKTPAHNLALLRELGTLRVLARPILLGTSRKSTLGKVLDLPPAERVEATVATTVLGAVAGVDILRVHDVLANVRAARMTDAVMRGPWPTDRVGPSEGAGQDGGAGPDEDAGPGGRTAR
jgi:dihydropteroate synthase